MRCYIETTADLDRGSTVRDGIDGHLNAARIWHLVEQRRPAEAISRTNGVPGALDPDDLAGLARRDAVAYVVEPMDGFEITDRGWLDMAARALDAGDPAAAEAFVDRYWTGTACEDESLSLTEVWMRTALVVREALWFEDRRVGGDEVLSGESYLTVDEYVQGGCGILAVAMHRLTGWDIEVFHDEDEPFFSRRGEEHSSVLHAMVSDPEGRLWDVCGRTRRNPSELLGSDRWTDVTSYSSESQFVADWCSTDWDSKPLPQFSEGAVLKAMEVARRVLAPTGRLAEDPKADAHSAMPRPCRAL